MENLKKKIQKAIEAYKSGDLLLAEKLSQKLILANPKVVFLYNLLGLISADLNKIDQSLKYYEDGIKIDSNDPNLYNNIAVLLFNNMYKNNIEKIEYNYKKSISLNNNNPEAYNNLANFYKSLNKTEEAIQNYRKAIEINPKFYFAFFNLASLYVSCGKLDEAKDKLNQVLELAPNYMHAHRLLSRITNYKNDNSHLEVLNKLYNQIKKKNDYNKMLLCYSLAKANEDIKDYSKSFMHYKEANEISRKNINFSIDDEKIKFDKIKETFTSETFSKYKNSGCKDYKPIFIVGMPRSGTTLVEQILSSHPDVFGCDEVEFVTEIINKNFGSYKSLFSSLLLSFESNNKQINKMAEDYMLKVNELSNFSKRTTDKLPTNFLYIGFIKLILPNAKIIHCYRNSKDNCMSIYKNHFTSGKVNFSSDLNEIVDYYNLYNDLMNFWKVMLPNFVYNINYEQLIDKTEDQVKELLKNCDLDWSKDCLNFDKNKRQIKTASDVQARQKIYKSSINSWNNYNKYLKDIFSHLKN